MMPIITTWSAAALLTTILLAFWKKVGIKDIPGQRSVHSATVPTAAGICILCVALFFFCIGHANFIFFDSASFAFILGFTILATIGFIDDWKELNYKTRLFSHILAVGLVLTQQNLNFTEYVIWFFIGVGLVNACNFLDGLNGLLASQWLLTIGFLLSAFAPLNSFFWIIWTSTFIYLFFNFPKARIFMGDTGSTILGFSYFTLIFTLTPNQHGFPSFIVAHDSFIIFALFPLGFAWGDIAFTIIRRVIEKRSITSSFGDYGFHYKAKIFHNHVPVTLIYLALNCILTYGAVLLFLNHHNIYLVCGLYSVAQIAHWKLIYRLSLRAK